MFHQFLRNNKPFIYYHVGLHWLYSRHTNTMQDCRGYVHMSLKYPLNNNSAQYGSLLLSIRIVAPQSDWCQCHSSANIHHRGLVFTEHFTRYYIILYTYMVHKRPKYRLWTPCRQLRPLCWRHGSSVCIARRTGRWHIPWEDRPPCWTPPRSPIPSLRLVLPSVCDLDIGLLIGRDRDLEQQKLNP